MRWRGLLAVGFVATAAGIGAGCGGGGSLSVADVTRTLTANAHPVQAVFTTNSSQELVIARGQDRTSLRVTWKNADGTMHNEYAMVDHGADIACAWESSADGSVVDAKPHSCQQNGASGNERTSTGLGLIDARWLLAQTAADYPDVRFKRGAGRKIAGLAADCYDERSDSPPIAATLCFSSELNLELSSVGTVNGQAGSLELKQYADHPASDAFTLPFPLGPAR